MKKRADWEELSPEGLKKGMRFGRLVLRIRLRPKRWVCDCDCGVLEPANAIDLIFGKMWRCHDCRAKGIGDAEGLSD